MFSRQPPDVPYGIQRLLSSWTLREPDEGAVVATMRSDNKLLARAKEKPSSTSKAVLAGAAAAAVAVPSALFKLAKASASENEVAVLDPVVDVKGPASILDSIFDSAKSWFADLNLGSVFSPKSTPTAVPSTTPKVEVDTSDVKVNQPGAEALNYIDEAARVSGVDKALLLAFANQESSFNPQAKSSIGARGLLQVTPVTWSHLIKTYGKVLGFKQADHKDPRKSTILGALYIRDMAASMKDFLKRPPSVVEIYLSHVLGPTGSRRLLNAMKENSSQSAVDLLPKAAQHNKNLFYSGSVPKTVAEVYDAFFGKVGKQYVKFAKEHALPMATPVSAVAVSLPDTSKQATSQSAAAVVPVSLPSKAAVKESNGSPTPVAIRLEPSERQTYPDKEPSKPAPQTSSKAAVALSGQIPEPPSFIKLRNGQLVDISKHNSLGGNHG